MSIPDFQTLMLPVLKLSAEKEWRISEAVERLAEEFHLLQEERATLLPSGRQTTFANRVGWAKSYLVKAGLLMPTKRAHFHISDQGRSVLSNPPDRITIKYLSQFPEFQEFWKPYGSDTESNHDAAPDSAHEQALTPDETIRQCAFPTGAGACGGVTYQDCLGTPAFFENLVVRLLFAMGYGGSVTEINKALVGGTGDGGVDGVIDQDILGLDRIYVQAKRTLDGNTVGSAAIREFFGSLDRFKATKGLFVTASTYTGQQRGKPQQR